MRGGGGLSSIGTRSPNVGFGMRKLLAVESCCTAIGKALENIPSQLLRAQLLCATRCPHETIKSYTAQGRADTHPQPRLLAAGVRRGWGRYEPSAVPVLPAALNLARQTPGTGTKMSRWPAHKYVLVSHQWIIQNCTHPEKWRKVSCA